MALDFELYYFDQQTWLWADLNWSSPSLEHWKSLHSVRDHIFWASPFLRKVGFIPDVSIGDVSIGFQILKNG